VRKCVREERGSFAYAVPLMVLDRDYSRWGSIRNRSETVELRGETRRMIRNFTGEPDNVVF
jgi:hypothetical protein